MFKIQRLPLAGALVWSKNIHDGSQVCVHTAASVADAEIWVANAMAKLKAIGY